MSKVCLFIFGLLCFISCKPTAEQEIPTQTGLSDSQIAKIDSICNVFIEKGNMQGVSIALAHKGDIVFSSGYGKANIASGKTATDSTIYPIASVSKLITAALTLRMVEKGKINLTDKVVDYFEDFPRQEYMDQITIEHLLRHQSGLVDHEDWLDSLYIQENRVFTDEEFFSFIDQPLFFKPGSSYTYSNAGYATLSMILEKIEGRSFHDLIINNISLPNNLSSLGTWPVMWSHESATMGYELNPEGVDTSLHMMTEGMKGDGGLSASVIDLVKFMTIVTDGSFISRDALDKMCSPTSVGNISIDYGLGTSFGYYAGQKVFGHAGGYKGTGWAMLAHYPESDYTFAAAMNTNYSQDEIWSLRHFIMPVVLNIGIPDFDSTALADVNRYTGTYSAPDRWGNHEPSIRNAFENDGALYWDNPNTESPGARLYPINDSIFSWPVYPFDAFRFHHVNGEVAACSEYYDGMFAAVWKKK